MDTHMKAQAEMLADLLSAQEDLDPDLEPWRSEGPIGGQHHDAGLGGVQLLNTLVATALEGFRLRATDLPRRRLVRRAKCRAGHLARGWPLAGPGGRCRASASS